MNDHDFYKYHLQWALQSEFGISWPKNVLPWELTVDELTGQIEQLVNRQSKNDPDETELRKRIFEEIKRSVMEVVEMNDGSITSGQRFNDLIPWHRRAKARAAIIRSLDRQYAWYFQREPTVGMIIVSFLVAGLAGAIWGDSFGTSPLMMLVALIVYILCGLFLDRFIAPHTTRFPANTIGEAVEEILDMKMMQARAHAKYHNNRNAIYDQLMEILTGIHAKSPALLLQTTLGKDFTIAEERRHE